MTFAESTNTDNQPYKHNDIELDNKLGLNLYDYSARQMDNAVPRFTSIDPHAEKYYSISPYVYCNNNPLKYIDPTGMVYDDYFNQQGIYLGTDNDPNSSKVRVINDAAWQTNKTGEKTIDHAVGVANSTLHSKSGINKEASMKIYEHYNTTGLKLSAEAGSFLMEFEISFVGNEELGRKINVNTGILNRSGFADNIADIENSFVHENKHNSDFNKKVGLMKVHSMSSQIKEERAISTQIAHPTWNNTSTEYKNHIKSYADDLNILILGLNAPTLKTSISAPLNIKKP